MRFPRRQREPYIPGSVVPEKESHTDNKHLRADDTPVDINNDEDENPGIGQSKGLFARSGADDRDAELIEGENTIEGDTENDATLGGGVNQRDAGRTND